MTQKYKELLLKDLNARILYGVKATTTSNGWKGVYTVTGYANNRIYLDCPIYDEDDDEWLVESVKPYLRPMSSMTAVEVGEYISLKEDIVGSDNLTYFFETHESIDWLNKKMFDYRKDDEGKTIIEKGLALVAPEGMYN